MLGRQTRRAGRAGERQCLGLLPTNENTDSILRAAGIGEPVRADTEPAPRRIALRIDLLERRAVSVLETPADAAQEFCDDTLLVVSRPWRNLFHRKKSHETRPVGRCTDHSTICGDNAEPLLDDFRLRELACRRGLCAQSQRKIAEQTPQGFLVTAPEFRPIYRAGGLHE